MDDTVFDERFDGEDQEESLGDQVEEVPFPNPLVDPLAELITLGHLEDSFNYGGNSIRMTTLTAGEELKAMRLLKEYEGVPMAEGRAFAAAMVSASIAEVNGLPLVMPLGPDHDIDELRFKKVLGWHFPIIEYFYRRFTKLEEKQAEVLNALRTSLEGEQDESSGSEATD